MTDPKVCSLPGFSAHGVFQAGIPEWVSISSSKNSLEIPVFKYYFKYTRGGKVWKEVEKQSWQHGDLKLDIEYVDMYYTSVSSLWHVRKVPPKSVLKKKPLLVPVVDFRLQPLVDRGYSYFPVVSSNGREKGELSGISFVRALSHSWRHQLIPSKAPHPITITLGAKISTYECWGDTDI